MVADYESTPTQYSTNTYGTSQYGDGDYTPPATTPVIQHQFEVVNPATIYVPEGRSVWNEFDEHGLVAGLPRLKTEKNSAYKRRIKDVFVNRANSSYRGLINSITRELGLSFFYPITINPRRSVVTDKFFAPDPYVRFDGAFLYLYSDYYNGVLDHKIDRYDSGGNYEHIGRLVDFINQTTYFEATVEDGFDEYTKSMTILDQSNRETQLIEDVQISTKFVLDNQRVVNKSFLSNNPEVFGIEVDTEEEVSSAGKYYIDYTKGIVRTFNMPDLGTVMRYHYTTFPFKPIASPIILHDINDENFKVKIFEQVLNDDGSYTHGVPTDIGADIINELMGVTPMYWGI